MTKKLKARHGTVCSLGTDFFGYFGWPSVARMDDGTLVAVASGLRNAHVCPFGRTTMMVSRDNGETWTTPRVINDSPCDDRDAGVVALGDERLLVSWFTSDNRERMRKSVLDMDDESTSRAWLSGMDWMTDEISERHCGAWVQRSEDAGATWAPPVRVLVNTPHGPIRLRNGSLLYFGKEFGMSHAEKGQVEGRIMAIESNNEGKTWSELGSVPIYPGSVHRSYHEPHVVETSDGTLIGHIRLQTYEEADVTDLGLVDFSIMQTTSEDGGKTWSEARPLGFHGSPPHLMLHSSGALVCTYGYRLEPYGERVAISTDGGRSWQHDFIIRDDGPDSDLGYPASVELGDGSVFSVYYQKEAAGAQCGVLWSRWELPRL